jgi:hypothetical protein
MHLALGTQYWTRRSTDAELLKGNFKIMRACQKNQEIMRSPFLYVAHHPPPHLPRCQKPPLAFPAITNRQAAFHLLVILDPLPNH